MLDTTSRNSEPEHRPYGGIRSKPKRIAVIGAGMAGIAAARTLTQAGHDVTVFEKQAEASGRTSVVNSVCGTYDVGAQYFTVRDARFQKALDTVPGLCRAWSVNTVRVLDEAGRVVAAAPPPGERHWVATPAMDALVKTWAQPLADKSRLVVNTTIVAIERDVVSPDQWQLRAQLPDGGNSVQAGFDTVLLAVPAPVAQAIQGEHQTLWEEQLAKVETAPCWTLMLGFPQAVRPGLTTLGPQWNAARSTHHRIAWLARESSKPGRSQVERWTVQASPQWSLEHVNDDPARVQAKLLRAFSEVTGIRATPSQIDIRRWRHARTMMPLGQSALWDDDAQLGMCGDWCLGHRLEDAFISGLELALASIDAAHSNKAFS
ncbi:FAD-dependent oxidoreductase [Diaphorobacter sp. HDW4B]|uniref:NAD(P)/FAD-dependent oxidoreductase n=1 Tax=Diaphorobacter sp. HDW4B TaxID=2714925 RepID=UPI0014095B2C|nr:FAD-dependent oxidoreductase [Diaphorobacter sp. HDW4B]QIL73001.1 FAD-dependent oxidoreductase [Diaphorobacter sp. HDW4B]